jgi:O-antigen ligase
MMLPAHLGGSLTIFLYSLRVATSSIAILFVFAYLFLAKNKYLTKNGVLLSYLCFAILACISILYSVDPLVTAGRAFEILAISVFGLVFLDSFSDFCDVEYFWNLTLKLLFALLAFYLAMTLFLNMSFVAYIDGTLQWTGYGGRNSITALGSVFFIVALNRYFMSAGVYRIGAGILGLFGFILMLASFSRSSVLLTFLVAVPYYLWLRRSLSVIFVLLYLGLIALIFYYENIYKFFLRGQDHNAVMEISGRFSVWERSIDFIRDSPWVGHGYYAANTLAWRDQVIYEVEASNVDNVFVEIALGLGVLGLAAMSGVFYCSFRLILRLQKVYFSRDSHLTSYLPEICMVLVFTLMRSMVNPTIQGNHWNLLLFFAAVAVGTAAVKMNDFKQ